MRLIPPCGVLYGPVRSCGALCAYGALWGAAERQEGERSDNDRLGTSDPRAFGGNRK